MVNNENGRPSSLREKLRREGRAFLLIFLYLAPCLTVLAWYKRAILADYSLFSLHQGYALVEALILSKMILLGQSQHLGETPGEKPLIYPTLYKAFVFSLFIIGFKLLERLLDGFLHHQTVVEITQEVLSRGWHEMLVSALLMFLIFTPFFAFQEIGRLTGEEKLFDLFFHQRSALTVPSSVGSPPSASA
jgi:hypothetical protein